MRPTTKYQRFVQSQLVSIAGRPQRVLDLHEYGLPTRVWVWAVTSRGVRKGDRSAILAVYDKATDLGLMAYRSHKIKKSLASWALADIIFNCNAEAATHVSVWCPSVAPS